MPFKNIYKFVPRIIVKFGQTMKRYVPFQVSLIINFILVDQLKTKWKGLQDGFKKCMDRQRDINKSDSWYSKPSTCRYYNQLQFLHDAISNKSTHSDIPVSRHAEISPPPSPAPLSPAVSTA